MNYREVEIQALKTLGDAGTEVIDLDLTEPLTELIIKFQQRNDSSSYNDYPVERQLTKIEIVDGGKSLWSLNGREAVGAVAVDDGHFPFGFITARASYNPNRYIPIRFGRYVGDPDFAFDPTKLRNPQLKVTYAIASMTSTYNRLAVYARVMSGVPSPSKCLVWRAIRGYNSSAGGTEPTELPVDHPYRRIMFRGYAAANNLGTVLNHYKVACDVDRLIVLDLGYEAMYALVAEEFGYIENDMIVRSKTGVYVQAFLCPAVTAVGTCGDEGEFVTLNTAQGGRVQVVGQNTSGGHEDGDVNLKLTGLNPHNCVIYQFGRRDHPDTWFRASQFKSIKAILEHDCVGEVSIAVQQPVTLGSP